jgi:hypothetical protein
MLANPLNPSNPSSSKQPRKQINKRLASSLPPQPPQAALRPAAAPHHPRHPHRAAPAAPAPAGPVASGGGASAHSTPLPNALPAGSSMGAHDMCPTEGWWSEPTLSLLPDKDLVLLEWTPQATYQFHPVIQVSRGYRGVFFYRQG